MTHGVVEPDSWNFEPAPEDLAPAVTWDWLEAVVPGFVRCGGVEVGGVLTDALRFAAHRQAGGGFAVNIVTAAGNACGLCRCCEHVRALAYVAGLELNTEGATS